MGDRTPTRTPTKTLFPSEESSDEEMDCKDKLFSSPGDYAGGRPRRSPKQTAASAVCENPSAPAVGNKPPLPLPKAGCFSPEESASGASGASGRTRPILTPEQTAANADGFRAACGNPSAPAVGNKPPLPKIPSPCKGTPMRPRSSIRTPMGPYSSGIAGAAAFDCTPVHQRPTNAEIIGGLTKDEVIFFDFDGVLSPVGLVSDRRDFKLKKIDRVDGLLFVNGIEVNGIEARQRDLNILKQQYSLCICSQNIHGHIVTFCNKFYPGFFDVIIGKKAIGCPKINKQDEMLKVLCGRRALFIDDSQGEIDAITKGGDITARQITQWTLNSKPAVLPVGPVDVGPRELRLRF